MSQRILRAVNQVRLTNVALVRLKTHGMRFEIACYRNKVVNWRNGVEKDLGEVLQAEVVFLNVSKGNLASSQQLIDAFGTDDRRACCLIILEKGELQVSDHERDHMLESSFKDVATLVADMCVNPQSQRPYPVSTIEQALHDIHFSLRSNKSIKKQALDVIPQLKELIPLERAHMKICVSGLVSDESFESDVKEKIGETGTLLLSSVRGDVRMMEVLVEPGKFRVLDELTKNRPGASMELLEFGVHEQGEADVEDVDISQLAVASSNKKSVSQKAKDAKVDDDDNNNDDDDDELKKQVQQGSSSKNKKKKKGKRLGNQQINPDKEEEKESKSKPHQQQQYTESLQAPKKLEGLSCLSCGISFGDDRVAQRDHYRSEWHRYNLKLKLIELPPCSQKEYDSMTTNDREAVLNML